MYGPRNTSTGKLGQRFQRAFDWLDTERLPSPHPLNALSISNSRLGKLPNVQQCENAGKWSQSGTRRLPSFDGLLHFSFWSSLLSKGWKHVQLGKLFTVVSGSLFSQYGQHIRKALGLAGLLPVVLCCTASLLLRLPLRPNW